MNNKNQQLDIPLKTRRELFIRASNQCEECDSKENLEAHHIKSKQKGIDHSLDNLSLLCRECHLRKGISHRESKDRRLCNLRIVLTENEHEYIKIVKERISKEKGKLLNWHDFLVLAGTTLAATRKAEE